MSAPATLALVLVCHSGKAATGASLGPRSPDAESRLALGKHTHEMADYGVVSPATSPGEEEWAPITIDLCNAMTGRLVRRSGPCPNMPLMPA